MQFATRLCSTLSLLAILLSPDFASADEPARLNLFVPSSLAGWQCRTPVEGWKIDDQTLTGSAGASLLLSSFTYGDFSLRFDWTVAPGAVLVVGFPAVPSGEGLKLRLSEAGKPTTLSNQGQIVLSSEVPPKTAGSKHTAQLDRTAGKLTLRIDDGAVGEIKVDAQMRFGLQLAADGGDVTVSSMTATEPAGESIFNGHDLTGWWSPQGLKSWQAKDGVIENLHKDGNYLRTEAEYGNFTLSFEYLASPHCNSGVGIRTAREGWPSGDGFELQILDQPGLVKDSTMAIYGNLEPLVRADRPQEWNRVVIKADGPMISAWVNGQLVQQANTAGHPELKHRHREGWIGLQDHGGKIEYRDLRVLSAPAGTGLAAWYAPHQLSGPEIVCDRLLNPERLSLPDGVTAGVAVPAPASSGEQVLADLTGPGAVTRIGLGQDSGELAFYFDGQSEPALVCSAANLWKKISPLFEQKEPSMTALAYAKSLKIVARKATHDDARIEYVNFPADTPIETFADGQPILPRGTLPALDYRGHQYSWGTHREADLEPRATGEVKKLEPGESAIVVSRTGQGIVQWLKLETNVSLLSKDDLWLEVVLDGESEPAIAAPARYFFPSLGGGTNHEGFLAVFRNGFTSMLAMPFAGGITVRARNAGSQPIGHVAVTLSILEDDSATWHKSNLGVDKRFRLRGRFVPASDSPQWLEWKGHGRWVGLISKSGSDNLPNFASLSLDGHDQPGWKGVSFDNVIGAASDEKEFFRLESGRSHGLAWRYWQLAPIEFQHSIAVTAAGPVPDHLVLVYVR